MAKSIDLKAALAAVMERLKQALSDEFEAQGHRLTGSFERALKYEIRPASGGGYTARMIGPEYGIFLEFGVRAARIPYSGRSGRGGRSAYIQGLIQYFERRGLPEREAQRAAFATAAVHRREGMPTRASYRFSRTGQRTGFIRTVLDRNMQEITDIIRDRVGMELRVNLADTLRLTTIRVPL